VDTGVVLGNPSIAVVADQHSVAEDNEDVGHHSAGGIENVAGSDLCSTG
jgi:hypothetical protein